MAKLEVTDGYVSARTQERVIWPGEYDSSDERLFGLASFLVRVGRARWLGDPEPEAVEADSSEGDPEPELEGGVRWTHAPDDDTMPATYAEATNPELEAEIKARDIKLVPGGGSGANGAYIHDDYVDMLITDDESHADAGA